MLASSKRMFEEYKTLVVKMTNYVIINVFTNNYY